MEIKEYAKTSKIPLKTLRWMERIKTISDPLPDNDLIGLKLLENLWGLHDFLDLKLSQKKHENIEKHSLTPVTWKQNGNAMRIPGS